VLAVGVSLGYAMRNLERDHGHLPLWLLALLWLPLVLRITLGPTRRAPSARRSDLGGDVAPLAGPDPRVGWSPYDDVNADRAWRQVTQTEPDATDSH
jgi:hypothetical protein